LGVRGVEPVKQNAHGSVEKIGRKGEEKKKSGGGSKAGRDQYESGNDKTSREGRGRGTPNIQRNEGGGDSRGGS